MKVACGPVAAARLSWLVGCRLGQVSVYGLAGSGMLAMVT